MQLMRPGSELQNDEATLEVKREYQEDDKTMFTVCIVTIDGEVTVEDLTVMQFAHKVATEDYVPVPIGPNGNLRALSEDYR